MGITRLKPLYNDAGKLQGYIDKYTGEEHGFPVIVGRKRNPYIQGWVMNSQQAMLSLAKDKDIKGETHRVLWFIGGILDFENWVTLSITEIAQELGLKQPSASRAIKVLEKKGIILRGPKLGRSFAFRLNPEFGWKGKVKHLDNYRQEVEDENFRAMQRQSQRELRLVEPTKEQQIIGAIQRKEIDIDKLYQFLCEEKGEK